MAIVEIFLVWSLISIPASLLMGRLLAYSSKAYPVADDRLAYDN